MVRQSPTTWKLRTTEPSNVSVRFTPEATNMLPDCRCVLPIVAFRIAVRHSSNPAPPSCCSDIAQFSGTTKPTQAEPAKTGRVIQHPIRGTREGMRPTPRSRLHREAQRVQTNPSVFYAHLLSRAWNNRLASSPPRKVGQQ